MTCETRSGRYKCKHAKDHSGDCEAEDASVFSFGPYRDGHRGRAYLRGCLDISSGALLDGLGGALKVGRLTVEDDVTYRERIWRSQT